MKKIFLEALQEAIIFSLVTFMMIACMAGLALVVMELW